MVDVSSLLTIVLYLIIVGAICWLLWWIIDFAGTPEPFNKIGKVIIAILAVIICINLLLQILGGTPFIKLR